MEIYDERTDKSIPVDEILANVLWDEEDTEDFCNHAAADKVSDSSDDHQIWRADDETCRVYYCRASLPSNTCLTITDLSVDWQEYFRSWDWDLWGDYNSMLSDFGIEPELDEVEDDYDGPCRVWVSYNYYQGTLGAPLDSWIVEDNDRAEIREFSSREEAQEYIDEAESGTYYLAHGEAGRPTYTICK
jgi:hypothetical protein